MTFHLSLIVMVPYTGTWEAHQRAEETAKPEYAAAGDVESVITDGRPRVLAHRAASSGGQPGADRFLSPGSDVDRIRQDAI